MRIFLWLDILSGAVYYQIEVIEIVYAAVAALAAFFILFCYFQNNTIDITEHIITSKNIHDSIKLVQLSDLHSKPFKKVLKRLDEIFAAPQIILTWRDNRSSVTAEREKYTASENVRLKSRTAF